MDDDFGHTLLGSKPMSFFGFFRDDFKGDLESFITTPDNSQQERGWQVVSHHLPAFPSSRFLMRRGENPSLSRGGLPGNQAMGMIFNKPQVRKTVEANLPVFQQVLGKKLSPAELAKKLESDNPDSYRLLNDEATLGILLGFSPQAALLFRESRANGLEPLRQAQMNNNQADIEKYQKIADDYKRILDLGDKKFLPMVKGYHHKSEPDPTRQVCFPAFWSAPDDPDTARIFTRFKQDCDQLEKLVRLPDSEFLTQFFTLWSQASEGGDELNLKA